jgi:hypothetical protein
VVERVEMGTDTSPSAIEAEVKANEEANAKADEQQDLNIKDLNTGDELQINADEKEHKPSEDGEFKVPEKFEGKSIEDVIKAYQELEKTKAEEKSPEPSKDDKNAQEAIDENFQKWSKEYADNGGQLSDETRQEIVKDHKIPEKYLDIYMAGVQALSGNFTADALKGAEVDAESYPEMLEWAANNMTEKEIAAFNKSTDGTSKETAIMAVKDLKARYNGDEPNLANGEKGGPQSQDAYKSEKELTKDINDERYQTGDRAFIKYVEEKLGRSDIMQGK